MSFLFVLLNRMKESIEHVDGRIKTIAIDGKSLRGTYDKERKTCLVHMVSAFAVEYGVVLGQVKTEEKSNESVPWALNPVF